MHCKMFYAILGALFALCVAANATPIPGSDNELRNPDFEDGWVHWEHGTGLALGEADGHGSAAYCKDPLDDLLLRQVVDDKLRPDGSPRPTWDDTKHAKWVDLTAQILCEDLKSPSTSGIKFRLDWWTEARNGIENPAQLPTPDGWSEWVTFNFADIPGYQPFTWITINPFNENKTLFAQFQPRWVSVEAQLIQGAGEVVWIDNLNLTAKCVPEPSMILALITGLVGMSGSRLFRRK